MKMEEQIMVMIIVGIPSILIVSFAFGSVTDEIQFNHYKPSFDLMSCDDIGKWIVEHRYDGNGFEQQIAKKEADLYPVKCGKNGTQLNFTKQEYTGNTELSIIIHEDLK